VKGKLISQLLYLKGSRLDVQGGVRVFQGLLLDYGKGNQSQEGSKTLTSSAGRGRTKVMDNGRSIAAYSEKRYCRSRSASKWGAIFQEAADEKKKRGLLKGTKKTTRQDRESGTREDSRIEKA